ncbi:RICIN domain-containing protein [Actinosynnema sp. NPDC023658]|uniref:RICIN domain-containing protein n=1 Tax=Actinosynnema sp. NPDC023658 TaxID=3155465 RepID=UPI0033EC895A
MLRFARPIGTAVAVVIALLTAGASPGAAATADGPFRVVNQNSGKCLAIPGGTTADHTRAIQFTCSPETASKQWDVVVLYTDEYGNRVHRLENRASHRCLGVAAESTSNGAAVWQESCSTSFFQRWAWDKAGRLHNVATDKCMAVPNGWLSDGVGIIQWTCGTGAEQRWALA